jgi:hypothetical protein
MQRIHGSRHIDADLRPLADNYLGYGLGFEIGQYRGKRAAGHGGMNLTYNCFFKLFPDDGAAVVVLTNQSSHRVVWELVTSLYNHALSLPRPANITALPPAALPNASTAEQLQEYVGSYLRIEIADLLSFNIVPNGLELEYQGKNHMLSAIGEDAFYAQISEKYSFPIVFVRNDAGKIIHLLLGGEPYHPVTVDPTLEADTALWKSFEGLYKDASNLNRNEMFRVSLRDSVLFVIEAQNEAPCKAIAPRSFLCDIGLIEFVDSPSAPSKILVWGKATRYYPVDQSLYESRGIIRYLVDVPQLPHRID